ncbi:MAG TPA: hypothetical protein VEK11_11305 [Thermoanaerobaculia bacterium]|nr:hypothetical protein [Thermoanaerobaculia bacterium]
MKRVLRELGAVLFFCLVTAVMTWPLVANFTTALPHPDDPAINTWILDWDFYALLHQPARLFEANIFHPLHHTLAFSENLLGIALPLLPLHLAGLGPVTIYNVATFLAFALTGYGAFVLARLVTGSTGAAVCSGIWFAFFSFRFTHLTHLQHLWAMGLPLTLAALLWFAQKPNAARAALFGFAFLMTGLANLHWFAFGSVAIGLSVLLLARRDRKYWIGAIGALVVPCLLMVPVLLPYQRVRELYGFRGDVNETLQYSARASDWLVSSLHSRWYAKQLADVSVNPERWLFPGALVLLFALLGIRRKAAIPLMWVILGFVGSLGLNSWFGELLFQVPLFKGIRVPARWSFIAYIGLALLAAIGIARIRHQAMHALIALLFLIECWAAPIRYFLTTPTPPVYAHVQGPLIELPLDQRDQYEYLLRATAHRQRMVNGVSGFVPPSFEALRALADTPQFLPRLEQLGVTTIVVHGDRISDTTRQWLRAQNLTFLGRYDAQLHGDYLFSTRRGKGAAPHERIHLERFLAGEPTQNEDTFGFLEWPARDSVIHGKLRVSGFALSPYGIRAVHLRFANGRRVVTADLVERPDVTLRYPWYPMTTHAGFVKELDAPLGDDVQVEIVDGRGRRTRLQDVWFTWAH